MDDYALVLNAGSSSLKFCVFQRQAGSSGDWRREDRSRASVHCLVCPLRAPKAKG